MQQIYCLPGTMCTALLWTDLQASAATDIEFIHIELPTANSPEHIVQRLAEQLPMQCSLLGFSLGGYLAALYATTFPDRVKSLCIMSNTPCPLNETELNTRAQTLAFLAKFRYTGMTQAKAKGMLDASHQTQTLIKRIIDMDAELGGETLIQQLSSTTERRDLADGLVQIDIPIHFIVSEQDPLVNQPWLDQLVALSKKISVKRITGSGHMLPIEQPENVLQQLRDSFC